MKDIPKFTDNVNFGSPNTQESNVAGSPTSQSPGLSSFSINLSSDDGGSNSSQRPIGSKKAKLKRKSQKLQLAPSSAGGGSGGFAASVAGCLSPFSILSFSFPVSSLSPSS
uniref:No apical meristem-associated C-terminal domain-containing protein n=1 Tax=Brassica oleracea var. oleracea TaxID=109376 RepID=A0A0D3BT79_BRAOL